VVGDGCGDGVVGDGCGDGVVGDGCGDGVVGDGCGDGVVGDGPVRLARGSARRTSWPASKQPTEMAAATRVRRSVDFICVPCRGRAPADASASGT